jgi:hypothetical protein
VRASHVTALAGKGIVQRYHGRNPSRSYFMGCSAGGVQAMWQAQRFPWDFDGIVAGGPALSLSRIFMSWISASRAFTDANGKPLLEPADLELLHQAVVAKCDLNDGIKDGLIGDPRRCDFSPAALRCAGDKNETCLAARQVEAAAKVYGGPKTSKGELVATPIAFRGSERTWSMWFGGSSAHPTPIHTYLKEWTHYSVFPVDLGPAWKPENFDFDRDYKRLGAMEVLEPMNSPDLRRFKALGGKLLMYTGWNDSIEGVLNTAEYYETAEKIMGGRGATQDFLRLFIVPGMNHCAGGEGAFAIDYLRHLEAWVEKGQAPEKLIGAHLRLDSPNDYSELARRLKFPLDPQRVEFTRPVYPYPKVAKYLGRGDPKDAASFGPAEP